MVFKMAGLSVSLFFNQTRGISTTCACYGKRNFRKFMLYSKRGSRFFKNEQRTNPHPAYPVWSRGARDVGYKTDDAFVTVPEMIPQLIIPDLTDFKLKPYVSYKVPEVIQSKFTSEDLFNAVYSKKIMEDFKAGKLDAEGNPLEPSVQESLTPEEAIAQARKTGCDIFSPK